MAQRWKPAVTVAAIIERDGRFLLVEEDTPDGLRWNQPAGHLEPGEAIADAAAREALEETAHPFAPSALLGVYLAATGAATYLRFAFVGVAGEPLPQPLDHGIRRAFWASADELRARPELHRSPVVMRCVDDYLAARQQGRPFIPLEALTYLSGDDTAGGALVKADAPPLGHLQEGVPGQGGGAGSEQSAGSANE